MVTAASPLTPMMQQYFKVKQEYPDSILFFRLGDFYEMFFDDAQKASGLLNIALTARDAGQERKAPMCGIPYHAAESYIAKLLGAGLKVTICEQVEDPKVAKGIVKREVVRTITPGTVFEAGVVADKKNNFLASVSEFNDRLGLSFMDITTGEFRVTEVFNPEELIRELSRLTPSECLMARGLEKEGLGPLIVREMPRMMISYIDDWKYDLETCNNLLKEHFHTQSLDGFGCRDRDAAVISAGIALNYVKETLGATLNHVLELSTYQKSDFLSLDKTSQRNLELLECLRPLEGNRGTLLWVLDQTRTSMGSRLLQDWIRRPLIDLDEINKRQDAIDELMQLGLEMGKLRESLGEVRDLERLLSRIHCGVANARDLVALKISLESLPLIRSHLESFQTPMLKEVLEDLVDVRELISLIQKAIQDEPP